MAWDLDVVLDVARRILTAVGVKTLTDFFAILLGPFIAFYLFRFVQWVRKGSTFEKRILRATNAVAKQEGPYGPIEGKGVWLTDPITFPRGYAGWFNGALPVLLLANLKGGVGKTTISANLAAYFARQGKRVLVIDLDFQGSLSSMLVTDEQRRPPEWQDSKVSRLISGEKDNSWPADVAIKMAGENIWTIPAYYDLAQAENRLLIDWLLSESPKIDVRYNLATLLHSSAVRQSFDLVVLDAPPRLTTGCVQAICASTHVLIPTILDHLSAEAVAQFASELMKLRPIAPFLQMVGVVGNQAGYALDAQARSAITFRLGKLGNPVELLPQETSIPNRVALSRAAGQVVAYLHQPDSPDYDVIRMAFDNLGAEVGRRMQI